MLKFLFNDPFHSSPTHTRLDLQTGIYYAQSRSRFDGVVQTIVTLSVLGLGLTIMHTTNPVHDTLTDVPVKVTKLKSPRRTTRKVTKKTIEVKKTKKA